MLNNIRKHISDLINSNNTLSLIGISHDSDKLEFGFTETNNKYFATMILYPDVYEFFMWEDSDETGRNFRCVKYKSDDEAIETAKEDLELFLKTAFK